MNKTQEEIEAEIDAFAEVVRALYEARRKQ